jgi:DNA-binding response OmpR family regulator
MTIDKLRILVVDDNHDAADSLARLLVSVGHKTHVAYGGRDAVVEAAAVLPDVAILDIGMPGFNGFDLSRELRSARHPVPVLIALTGWPQESVEKHGEFDHFLSKPVNLDSLITLLGSIDRRNGRL